MASLASPAGILRRSGTLPWRLPLMVVAAVLALRLGSDATANVSYFLLAAYALTGRAAAIQALALSWLITMFNPGIAPEASIGALGRFLVLFSAAASVFYRSGLLSDWRLKRFSLMTLGILAFIVVHSVAFSVMPDVSVLKAVAWGLAMLTLVAAWSSVEMPERRAVFEQVYWGLVAVIVLSLPLLVMPVGYLRNGSGFQGLINHPQAFGVMVALVGAIALGRLLGEKKPSWVALGIGVMCLVLVVLSETRTAGVALVFGVAIAAVSIPILANRKPGVILPGLKSKRFYVLAFFMLIGLILAGPTLNQITTDFISKSGRAQVGGLVEAYDTSRGFMIVAMTDNIKADPFVGVGFGVPSDPYFLRIQRDPILNLPIGAPIEKGIMPLALLEELGVIGFSLFLLWFWMIIRSAASAGMAPLAVVLTALLINMGESIFFSPGGMGMLVLIMVSWAYAMGIENRKPR